MCSKVILYIYIYTYTHTHFSDFWNRQFCYVTHNLSAFFLSLGPKFPFGKKKRSFLFPKCILVVVIHMRSRMAAHPGPLRLGSGILRLLPNCWESNKRWWRGCGGWAAPSLPQGQPFNSRHPLWDSKNRWEAGVQAALSTWASRGQGLLWHATCR